MRVAWRGKKLTTSAPHREPKRSGMAKEAGRDSAPERATGFDGSMEGRWHPELLLLVKTAGTVYSSTTASLAPKPASVSGSSHRGPVRTSYSVTGFKPRSGEGRAFRAGRLKTSRLEGGVGDTRHGSGCRCLSRRVPTCSMHAHHFQDALGLD